jgi:hypothetical protein
MNEQPKRNIGKRLVEAVAQTMELIQAESRASSRRIEALAALVATHE